MANTIPHITINKDRVDFVFKSNELLHSTVELQNPSAKRLAFKWFSNEPDNFNVIPCSGFLSPGEAISVTVIKRAATSLPGPLDRIGTFKVLSQEVDRNCEKSDAELWSSVYMGSVCKAHNIYELKIWSYVHRSDFKNASPRLEQKYNSLRLDSDCKDLIKKTEQLQLDFNRIEAELQALRQLREKVDNDKKKKRKFELGGWKLVASLTGSFLLGVIV